jgi:hypothetical protein
VWLRDQVLIAEFEVCLERPQEEIQLISASPLKGLEVISKLLCLVPLSAAKGLVI